MQYRFYQAGFIPGVPGIFAGVVVEVDDVTNEIISTTPLNDPSLSIAEPPPSEPAPDPTPPPDILTGA